MATTELNFDIEQAITDFIELGSRVADALDEENKNGGENTVDVVRKRLEEAGYK